MSFSPEEPVAFPHPLRAKTPEPEPAWSGGDGPEAPSESRSIDLRRVWALFLRHIRIFSTVAALVFIAAVVLTMRATPLYTATANVMLDVRKTNVVNTTQVLSGLPADSGTIHTEVEVLKSRHLAERVGQDLKLDSDPEFAPQFRKQGAISSAISSVTGIFKGAAPDMARAHLTDVERQKQHEMVVDRVLHRLAVKRVGLTYVMSIGFTSESPARAALIVNTFANRYLTEQMDAKFDATRNANQWLNERLGQLRTQVQEAETAVETYKISNNLMSASGSTLTEQEISNYNQQAATARAQVSEDEARLRTAQAQLAAGSSGEDVGEALGSTVIQQLRAQRAQVSGQVADLAGKYGPRHPEMLKAQRQLADIDAQIQAEIRRIISNLQAKVSVSRQRAGSIEGSLSGAKGTLAVNNRAAIHLRELERNAESVKTLYESFLNRFKETSADQGIERSDARVVSPAKIPNERSSPKVRANLFIGLVLAFAAGVGAVVISEMLNQGLVTAEDVERRLDLPHLGSIPHLDSVTDERGVSPVDFLLDKPLSSFAESFRALRTSLLYSRLGEVTKIIAVTSALPDEGKTTTSLGLARSAAQAGDRAIIVDCDLRRRNVNRILGVEPERGLLDVLTGQVRLEDVLLHDEKSGCYVLPLAKSAFTPKDVFGSAAMDRLLVTLRERFDVIVLDTAPTLAVSDTRVIGAKADMVLFLTRWRKTPLKAVQAAVKVLTNAGARVPGIALTQVDAKEQARYGYGDPGYYYSEYKKYYAG